jgi:hypothetical protein
MLKYFYIYLKCRKYLNYFSRMDILLYSIRTKFEDCIINTLEETKKRKFKQCRGVVETLLRHNFSRLRTHHGRVPGRSSSPPAP